MIKRRYLTFSITKIRTLYNRPMPRSTGKQLFILKAGFICGKGSDPHYSREILLNGIPKYAVWIQITYCISLVPVGAHTFIWFCKLSASDR